MEIEVALDGLEVDDALRADVGWILNTVLLHDFASALDDAAYAGFADKHVMRFFGEHEPARARKRIEPGLGKGAELEFAIAVGEEREHVEGHPVRCGFVERTEDARIVFVASRA